MSEKLDRIRSPAWGGLSCSGRRPGPSSPCWRGAPGRAPAFFRTSTAALVRSISNCMSKMMRLSSPGSSGRSPSRALLSMGASFPSPASMASVQAPLPGLKPFLPSPDGLPRRLWRAPPREGSSRRRRQGSPREGPFGRACVSLLLPMRTPNCLILSPHVPEGIVTGETRDNTLRPRVTRDSSAGRKPLASGREGLNRRWWTAR